MRVTPEEEALWRRMAADQGQLVDVGDAVNHPPHYQLAEGLEVYDLRQMLAAKAQAEGMGMAAYSDWDRALEYLLRAPFKNKSEDVEKCVWYCQQLAQKLSA